MKLVAWRKSVSCSDVSLAVLTIYIFLVCFPSHSLGHVSSMHGSKECGVIKNEYSYLQGWRESDDMCIYASAFSLFVFR